MAISRQLSVFSLYMSKSSYEAPHFEKIVFPDKAPREAHIKR